MCFYSWLQGAPGDAVELAESSAATVLSGSPLNRLEEHNTLDRAAIETRLEQALRMCASTPLSTVASDRLGQCDRHVNALALFCPWEAVLR